MKVVIEVVPQLSGKRGIGVYTENLIKCLAEIDKESEYIIFSWFFRDYEEKLRMLFCPKQENFSLLVKKFPDSLVNKLEWQIGLPIIRNFLKDKIDIYHSLGPRLPKLKNIKKVITVHDLIYEIHPEWVNNKFLRANREAIKNADLIIADSKNTKEDLLRFYNLNEEKIQVVYLGVDRKVFRPIEDAKMTKQKYSLPDRFILGVGPFEPRRNIVGLLKAYKKIKEKISFDYKVVLVGNETDEIKKEIQELGLTKDVIFTGYVPQNDLVAIYSLATIFVHPSFYEGFGLQILEAMSCGCPVITSNISSLPEVAGKAGLLVNPHNIEEISEAIYKLISDSNLRDRLVKEGFLQVEEFSWQKTAEKTLEIYKSLL